MKFSGTNKLQTGKCMMGKYGAFVLFKNDIQTSAGVKEPQLTKSLPPSDLGRQLCQHIVGMNPLAIGEPPSPKDQPTIEEEKPVSSGDIGVHDDDLETVEVKKNTMDETLLLHQEFLLDTDLNVHEFLLQNKAEVVDFIRFECGEDDMPETPVTQSSGA